MLFQRRCIKRDLMGNSVKISLYVAFLDLCNQCNNVIRYTVFQYGVSVVSRIQIIFCNIGIMQWAKKGAQWLSGRALGPEIEGLHVGSSLNESTALCP